MGCTLTSKFSSQSVVEVCILFFSVKCVVPLYQVLPPMFLSSTFRPAFGLNDKTKHTVGKNLIKTQNSYAWLISNSFFSSYNTTDYSISYAAKSTYVLDVLYAEANPGQQVILYTKKTGVISASSNQAWMVV